MAKKQETEQNHNNIISAINAVRAETKMVVKDMQAPKEAGDFPYISAPGLISQLRDSFIKHGIVRVRIKSTNIGRYANGSGVDVEQTYRYYLQHSMDKVSAEHPLIEGKDYIDVQVSASGRAGKSGDKSIFAAATTGGKYADLDAIYLPVFDDIEAYDEASDALKYIQRFTDDKKDEPESRKAKIEKPKEKNPDEDEPADKPKNKKRGRPSKKKKPKDDEPWEDPNNNDDPDEPDDPDDNDSDFDSEEINLSEIDYDDIEETNKLMELLDLEDDDMIKECLESFEDVDTLKAFFNTCNDYIRTNEGQQKARDFVDKWFETLQEMATSLSDD